MTTHPAFAFFSVRTANDNRENAHRWVALAVLLAAVQLPASAATITAIGAFAPSATRAQICTFGYAHAHRNVPYRVRDIVYDRFGLPRGHRRGYVIDHLIPLELGGTNAIENLWPQPRAAAHRKDLDEDRLHEELCAGTISLVDARSEMLRLWKHAP
ncbi:MAG: HNH endonuclease [Candidatus Eremiobacteraeota bacterium]|nr:HNH endonuclease [Candidatus Eremiobacteraeota bacterium]